VLQPIVAEARRFQLVLIKPSHYDDDGYVIRWWRAMTPSNSLAAVYGIAADCAERQVLGPNVAIDIRVRAGFQGTRYPSPSGLPRAQEHPAHGAIYRAVADPVQGFLEGLILGKEHRSMPRHPVDPRLTGTGTPTTACVVNEWPFGACRHHERRAAKQSPAISPSAWAFPRASGRLRRGFPFFVRHADQGRPHAGTQAHQCASSLGSPEAGSCV
jgi:hypothetical protein